MTEDQAITALADLTIAGFGPGAELLCTVRGTYAIQVNDGSGFAPILQTEKQVRSYLRRKR